MTGSGKTGLGMVLIEEALLQGIPVLAIDPKGDLGNLLLAFPDLAPADFAPWVEGGRCRRGGPGLAGGAGRVGHRRRPHPGLEGCGDGHDLHARDRRPGPRSTSSDRSAAPADPSDVETVRDEVEGFVSGLLDHGRHPGRPAVEPRAHPPVEPDRARLGVGSEPRPGAPWSGRCSNRRSASSACSTSTRSSLRTTAPRWPCGSTVCWRRPRSRRGRPVRRSTSTRSCATARSREPRSCRWPTCPTTSASSSSPRCCRS